MEDLVRSCLVFVTVVAPKPKPKPEPELERGAQQQWPKDETKLEIFSSLCLFVCLLNRCSLDKRLRESNGREPPSLLNILQLNTCQVLLVQIFLAEHNIVIATLRSWKGEESSRFVSVTNYNVYN